MTIWSTLLLMLNFLGEFIMEIVADSQSRFNFYLNLISVSFVANLCGHSAPSTCGHATRQVTINTHIVFNTDYLVNSLSHFNPKTTSAESDNI